jgi:hypothetical protein
LLENWGSYSDSLPPQWDSQGCSGLEAVRTAEENQFVKQSRSFNDYLTQCIPLRGARECYQLAADMAEYDGEYTRARAQTSVRRPTVAVKIDSAAPVLAQISLTFGRAQEAISNVTKLNQCITAVNQNTTDDVTADDCARFIQQDPSTLLNGDQISRCVQGLDTSSSCGVERFPVVASALDQAVEVRTTIADCMANGGAEVDCRRILSENRGTDLTGGQIASCILNPSVSPTCADLNGIYQSPAYVSCSISQLGQCINSRTCIFDQHSNLFKNIGASCHGGSGVAVPGQNGDQIPNQTYTISCNPETDWLSRNGEAGHDCCGGGNQECKSGVCNAPVGEKGLCAEPIASTGGSSGSGAEATTGTATESRTDCSKTNGIVQGSSTDGFVLKCDFDGNGSFGHHQPTAFIYGGEAAAACRTLCADPTVDVEAAARQRYRELQVTTATGGQSPVSQPTSFADLECAPPSFVSQFACVSFNESPCVLSDVNEGCYRAASATERAEVCSQPYQRSQGECSSFFRGQCARHPQTGCWEEKARVDAANEEFATEIATGQQEIEVSVTVTRNVFQQLVANVQQTVSDWRQGWDDFWAGVRGEETTESTTETDTGEETAGESTEESSEETTTPSSGGELVLLNNGRSINDGSTPMNNGNMQVEAYCRDLGEVRDTGTEWYCETPDGRTRRTLIEGNFTEICRQTYPDATNVEARNATGRSDGWRCYGNQ